MKAQWDYTTFADAYLKRPDYAELAIDQILARSHVGHDAPVCDIGAGVAHLTLPLARRGCTVTAIEPNDAMRRLGRERTAEYPSVQWREGTGEVTGEPANTFALVTFGSSFNVTDRMAALRETARILRPRGWFSCLWNHRDLMDPLQAAIEAVIRRHLPEYGYGVRREDQTTTIMASELFEAVEHFEARVTHRQSTDDCIAAWRSHATLARQSGTRFEEIIAAITSVVESAGTAPLAIPYVTRVWIARRNERDPA